ncbi:reverse transcriptase domain-containing protein [Tanacetum coccineum]
MRTRSSFNLVGNSSSNPTTSNSKCHNRRRSKQPFTLEESPVVMMTDQRTMAELLRAPTEGYAEAIVVPPILAEHFELKHSLINMITSDQFFGLEKDNPHDHIRAARRWLEKELPRSILTWEDLSFHEAWDRYKDLLLACPHHGFTELHQLDTFYNALNPADQDSLNSAAVKSSDGNSSSSDIAKLTHAVNRQTSAVTTAMTAILKQFQATLPPASEKAIEEICVTCCGAHPYYQCLAANGNTFPEYRDNIQGYVVAVAGNYNQGNSGYRPPGVANQTRPPGFVQQNRQNNQNRFSQPQGYNRGNNFNQNANYQAPIQQNQSVPLSELEKIKKMNDVNIKAMQAQINNVKNELRNEMQSSIQASMSNQTNELKNMMASFFQMNTASTSGTGSLPSNTVANPKGELKAITTRSGLVLDGPTVPMPPPFINPEEDERVEETLTDPEHGEFTIKVPPPLVQKAKPPSQRNYVVHQRDPRHPHIPYPSRMNQEKRQEKDEVQIHKFWQMFKQLHINISLADALILIPKYQKMLKSLLSNKEKLIELANTPLNENFLAVILKKLPEKLGDPGKFLIPCGFSELKCKALADLGASINLMPLSVGKFIFLADFVIVDYESDPRVPLILGRPFLRTARALIDVHGEEMILRDVVYNKSSKWQSHFFFSSRLNIVKVNDDIFDPEEDIIENLLNLDKTKDLPPYHDNPLSGNPTPISEPETKSSSSSPTLTSIEESDLIWEEFEAYLASDSFPPGNSNPSSPLPLFHNSLSGSTTSSLPSLPISETSDYFLKEFADELALITFPPGSDDLPFDAESDLREIEYLLNHDPIEEIDSILEDSIDENSLDDTISEISSDFLPSPECDSVFYVDFFKVDALSSTNNEDKVFNPGILIHENLFEVTNCATPEKNVKKATNTSLILENINPHLYELPCHKEVPGLEALLSKRISDKRTKNKVKNDKTEHGLEKREKDKEKVKAKSNSRSTPTKSKVKTEAVTEEILNGPPLPI